MLYIKLNLTSMISKAIGKFFPDRIIKSRDSKMLKTRSNVRDNFTSNTQNEKVKLFLIPILRFPFFANFNPW